MLTIPGVKGRPRPIYPLIPVTEPGAAGLVGTITDANSNSASSAGSAGGRTPLCPTSLLFPHTFPSSGVYTVKLTVSDENGASHEVSRILKVFKGGHVELDGLDGLTGGAPSATFIGRLDLARAASTFGAEKIGTLVVLDSSDIGRAQASATGAFARQQVRCPDCIPKQMRRSNVRGIPAAGSSGRDSKHVAFFRRDTRKHRPCLRFVGSTSI